MFLIGKRLLALETISRINPMAVVGRACSHGVLGSVQLKGMVGCLVKSVREKTAKIPVLHISMCSVSSFKPSGRSGKMRALSFKTGIACLCGTEVKEKLQCECNSSISVMLVGGGVLQERQEGDQKICRIFVFGLCRGVLASPGDVFSPPVYFLGLK